MKDDIDLLIAATELANLKYHPLAGREDAVKLKAFGSPLAFGEDIADSYPSDYGIWMDATPDALDGPLDVSIATVNPSVSSIGFYRARQTDARRARGRVLHVARSGVLVEVVRASVNVDTLKGTSAREYWVWVRESWHDVTVRKKTTYTEHFAEEHLKRRVVSPEILWLLAGIQFNRPYFWHVEFRDGDGLGVPLVLPTDPVGARSILEDRDKVGARRPALRNWVTSHWRQLRSDPESEAYVRQHLRGRTTVRWNGYDVTIWPSKEDVTRATAYAAADRPEPRARGAS